MQKCVDGVMIDLTPEEEREILARVAQGQAEVATIEADAKSRKDKIAAFKAKGDKVTLKDVVEMVVVLLEKEPLA